ncbi:hypothetical protein [Helicobacter marmotae]|nr:hypothetical protein [Helicobacter marmotae]
MIKNSHKIILTDYYFGRDCSLDYLIKIQSLWLSMFLLDKNQKTA